MSEQLIHLAIEEAKKSLPDDVPVGAIIADSSGSVISVAHNKREADTNSLHHAEILVIQEACKKLNTRRLNDCTIYITLEPCVMCAGALVQAQIGKVVFGAHDIKYGAAGSIYNFFTDPRLNHNTEVVGGVLENECAELLNTFFQSIR